MRTHPQLRRSQRARVDVAQRPRRCVTSASTRSPTAAPRRSDRASRPPERLELVAGPRWGRNAGPCVSRSDGPWASGDDVIHHRRHRPVLAQFFNQLGAPPSCARWIANGRQVRVGDGNRPLYGVLLLRCDADYLTDTFIEGQHGAGLAQLPFDAREGLPCSQGKRSTAASLKPAHTEIPSETRPRRCPEMLASVSH